MSKHAALTTREVAKLLGWFVGRVMRQARTGRIPASKVGREWRFRPEELEWFVEDPITRERLEDHGMALTVAERKAAPANWRFTSLRDLLRERGL